MYFCSCSESCVVLCSSVISLVLTTYLLLLSARVGEYYKFGYHYSCLHLKATGTTTEPDRAFILPPSFSEVPKRRTNRAFMNCRVPYDVSGICSFQLKKLSGDVHPNPGPSRTGIKFPCGECQRSVRSNQDAILCAACDQWFHARCIGIGKQVFKYYLENHHLDWECAFCSPPKFSDSFFDQTGNESLIEWDSIQNESSTNVLTSLDKANPRDDAENYLQQAALHLNSSTKDLNIAHLNVCSIRNKIDELRVLQSICAFDIIAITENASRWLNF